MSYHHSGGISAGGFLESNETTGGTPEGVEAFSDSLFGYHPLLLAAGIFSAILGLQPVVGLSHLVKLP